MRYEELHERYGSHIAARVQLELSSAEFEQVVVDDLLTFLEKRAEIAHSEYQSYMTNPLRDESVKGKEKFNPDVAHQRWREAEDLAYLIAIAQGVSDQTRVAMQK